MFKKKIDSLGRICIPVEIKKSLEIENGDMLDIEVEDNKITISKAPVEKMKKDELIKQKLDNLNKLKESGFEDDKLLGSIETLEWVLDTELNPNDYLNDYDD